MKKPTIQKAEFHIIEVSIKEMFDTLNDTYYNIISGSCSDKQALIEKIEFIRKTMISLIRFEGCGVLLNVDREKVLKIFSSGSTRFVIPQRVMDIMESVPNNFILYIVNDKGDDRAVRILCDEIEY